MDKAFSDNILTFEITNIYKKKLFLTYMGRKLSLFDMISNKPKINCIS